jgi:hypothetical protein
VTHDANHPARRLRWLRSADRGDTASFREGLGRARRSRDAAQAETSRKKKGRCECDAPASAFPFALGYGPGYSSSASLGSPLVGAPSQGLGGGEASHGGSAANAPQVTYSEPWGSLTAKP